jgi:hypothetical protein
VCKHEAGEGAAIFKLGVTFSNGGCTEEKIYYFEVAI